MIPLTLRIVRGALVLWCAWALVILPVQLPIALAQSASPGRPRVAVLEFEGVGLKGAEAAAVTDQLRSDLVRLKVFTVLDRAQTQAVLDEMALQQTGMTDPEQAAKIGQLLNVQYIITGRITALTNAYQVNAQMIRVETGVIEKSESILYQGHILGLLSDNIASIAARLGSVDDGTPRSGPLVAKEKVEEEGGWPWWAWALIGVGVVGVAVAAGGGSSDSGGGGTDPCASGCGSVSISW